MEAGGPVGMLEAPALVVTLFLMLLLCTMACGWMAGRKKRQRVGTNQEASGLVLQVVKPVTSRSHKARTPDRYSAEQLVILPIDDIGQTLAVPTIVITPPSPLGTALADGLSLSSDSSIGSANDLILNGDNEGCIIDHDIKDDDNGGRTFSPSEEENSVLHREGGILIRGQFIRDSMRNTFSDDPASPTPHNNVGYNSRKSSWSKDRDTRGSGKHNKKTTYHTSYYHSFSKSSTKSSSQEPRDSRTPQSGLTKDSGMGLKSDCSVYRGDSCVVNESDDDYFSHHSTPRPRLSSMEPGTRRPSGLTMSHDLDT